MVTPNRTCLHCGAPLSPGEAFCSNCGKNYESDMIDSMQPTASANQGSSNPSLPQIEPSQFAGPFSPPASSGNTYGQGGQSFAQAPTSPTENRVPLSSPTEKSEPFARQLPMPSFLGSFAPLLQLKKVPKVWIIVSAALLILILVGSSLLFLSRIKGNGANVTDVNTTTRGITQPALFSDSFVDNSKGWATGSGPGYSSAIGNNEMTLSEANHKILDEPVPRSNATPATFSDFLVTTTFTILKADQNDSVGLYLRGNDQLSQGYFVDIFGDNTYDIVKVFPDSGKDIFLISPTSSSAINAVGQPNKLTVIMKGSSIVLLINDKAVNSITDSTYTSGQIALFAENGRTSNGVNATFDSVAVYPAPAQLPS